MIPGILFKTTIKKEEYVRTDVSRLFLLLIPKAKNEIHEMAGLLTYSRY